MNLEGSMDNFLDFLNERFGLADLVEEGRIQT